LVNQFIEYDFKFLCEAAKRAVPEPLWPDTDKEPLPAPLTHQIVKKPVVRQDRKDIKMFSIWTALPEDKKPVEGEEQPEDGAEKEGGEVQPMTKD
jgi:hypothetical protein